MTTWRDRSPGANSGSGAQTLARGGALNLAGALVQQAALFAVLGLLATSLGAADLGRYSLLYGMLALLSLLGLAGFRAGMTRFVAIYLADNDPARLRGTVRLGMGVTVLGSSALAVGLALVAGYRRRVRSSRLGPSSRSRCSAGCPPSRRRASSGRAR